MLPANRLKLAIQIQSQSYRLLKWVAEAVGKGFIPVERVHRYANACDSAYAWIEEHYHNFPANLLVERQQLRQFANFFATYVTSSFDIVVQPGTKLVTQCGCYCSLCAYLLQAPHLRTKKLLSRDKKRANRLMEDRLIRLASEAGLPELKDVSRFVLGEATRRSAAYSTYGYWLIRRLAGDTDGPAVLSLWREIAWTRAGSPLPKFKLEFEDFVAAEELLLVAIQAQAV